MNTSPNIKFFKAVRLIAETKDFHNIECLVAILSELKNPNPQISDMSYYIFTPAEAEIFVADQHTEIAQYLISNLNDTIRLDMSEFQKSSIGFGEDFVKRSLQGTSFSNGENLEAYFHKNYLRVKNEKILTDNTEDSKEFANAINECILYHHTDMYFYSAYRLIIDTELKLNNEQGILDLFEVYDKFLILSAILLKALGNIEIPSFNKVNTTVIGYYNKHYSRVLEYGETLTNVIARYVDLREEVIEVIDDQFDENDRVMWPTFVANCFFKGFLIASNRIKNNLDNQDFFAHEFVKTRGNQAIKLFPTPKGLLNMEKLVQMAKENKLYELIDNYFLIHGIKRIKDDLLKKRLLTKLILTIPNSKGFYYFKRRIKDNIEYVPFGEFNRKGPLVALLSQCQVNLTRLTN